MRDGDSGCHGFGKATGVLYLLCSATDGLSEGGVVHACTLQQHD